MLSIVYDDDDDDAGLSSGTDGTNLKVENTSGAKRRQVFLSCPPLFCFTSTISRFGERFRDDQYSLANFFFCSSTLGAPVPSHL